MGRDCLSFKIGLVRLLAEDWGPFYARAPVLLCLQRTRAPWKEPESNWSPPQRQSSVSLLTRYRPQSFETEPGARGRRRRNLSLAEAVKWRISADANSITAKRGVQVMFQIVSRKPPSSLIARCLANRLAHCDNVKETAVRNQVSRNWTEKIKSALTKFAAAGVLSLCSAVSALAGSFTQPGSTIGPPAGAPIPPGVLFSDWITQGSRTSPSRPPLGRQHLDLGLVDALDDCGGQGAVDCGAGHTRVVRRIRLFLLWPVRSLCRRAIGLGSRPGMGLSAT